MCCWSEESNAAQKFGVSQLTCAGPCYCGLAMGSTLSSTSSLLPECQTCALCVTRIKKPIMLEKYTGGDPQNVWTPAKHLRRDTALRCSVFAAKRASIPLSFFVPSPPSRGAPARPRRQPPEHMCVSQPSCPARRRRGRAPFAWSRSLSEGSAAPGPVMQQSCAGRPPC